MASSSGSTPTAAAAAAAGLHGGSSCIDLTRDDDNLEVAPNRYRRHGPIMDDGNSYPGGTPPSVTNNASIKGPVVIDLASCPDSDEEDGSTKKRSLQRNNSASNYNYCHGPSRNSSSPMRKRRTTRLTQLNHNLGDSGQSSSQINMPCRRTRDGATITFGLLSLIDILKDESNTLTCEGSVASSQNKLLNPVRMSTSSLPFIHQPFHYLQNDEWVSIHIFTLIFSQNKTMKNIFCSRIFLNLSFAIQ